MSFSNEGQADKIINILSDSRTNTDIIAEVLMRTPFAVQQRLFHLFCQYIYRQAKCYDYGGFINNTDEIAIISKDIRDEVLANYQPKPNPGEPAKVPSIWA